MVWPRDIVNTVTKHIVSNFNYIETGLCKDEFHKHTCECKCNYTNTSGVKT